MTTSLSRRSFLASGGAAGAGLLVAGQSGAAVAAAKPRKSAATVILGGNVVPTAFGPRAQAVAVGRDGRILKVGSNSDVRRLIGRDTEVVDAEGGTVIAGIHDGHVHPMYAGLAMLNPSLGDAQFTIPELQGVLTGFLEASSDQEPDGWLVVEAWNPVGLLPNGTVAHRQYLDALDTARPIILNGSDGHNSWVNTRALEIAGVTAATPQPDGGEIVKDANGPTGLLKDSAQDLVRAFIPEPSWEVQMGAITEAFALMAAGGITSVSDAWVAEWQLDAYAELAAAGTLKQRVIPCLLPPDDLIGAPADALAWAQGLAAAYDGIPGVRFGTIKVFMDGVMEYPAQTAALIDPYLDADGNPTDNHGDLYIDGPTMGALVTAFDAANWQVHAHAIGDLAVRTALDGYQAARRANGRRDNRHSIAHLQLVHPRDYPRFAQLGVVADMQLQWASVNVYTMEALEPFIGAARHKRLYPARSLQRAGAAMAGGSDWPVDALLPWNQVETAINRIGLYGEGGPLNAAEGLTRAMSLRMHTLGTAFQMHQERQTGTLRAGKQADLVVLDRDITTGPVTEIRDAQPVLTLKGGEATFDASSAAGRQVRRRAEKAAATQAAVVSKGTHDFADRHGRCPCSRHAHK